MAGQRTRWNPVPDPSSPIQLIKNCLNGEIAIARGRNDWRLQNSLRDILHNVSNLKTEEDVWEAVAPSTQTQYHRQIQNLRGDESLIRSYVRQWTVRLDILRKFPVAKDLRFPDRWRRDTLWKMRQEMKMLLNGDRSWLWSSNVARDREEEMGRGYRPWGK